MTPQQFIEKAIDGGWRSGEKPDLTENNDGCWVEFFGGGNTGVLHFSNIILDPLAWQAVGKAMGWKEEEFYPNHPSQPELGGARMPEAKWYMLNMFQELWKGRTIEQFLEKL